MVRRCHVVRGPDLRCSGSLPGFESKDPPSGAVDAGVCPGVAISSVLLLGWQNLGKLLLREVLKHRKGNCGRMLQILSSHASRCEEEVS